MVGLDPAMTPYTAYFRSAATRFNPAGTSNMLPGTAP